MTRDMIVEAGALADAIQLAASCGVPSHWPESAGLVLRDAARLAELHRQIVTALVLGHQLVSRQRNEALGAGTN